MKPLSLITASTLLLPLIIFGEAKAQDNTMWDGFYGSVLAGRSFGQVNEPSAYWNDIPAPYPNTTISPGSESLAGWVGT